jgi:hypothetical protein
VDRLNGNGQAATGTPNVQPSPADGQVAPQALSERKYRGEPSNRRVKTLLEQIFGHSLDAQIQGLLHVRKGAQVVVHKAKDDELSAAYQRGRADLTAEIVFAERLAAIRSKYVDFDHAWASVRPLVPRCIWEEAADLEHGLEGAYQLSKLPELARELAELEPERARQRFQHFVRDLVALTKGMR